MKTTRYVWTVDGKRLPDPSGDPATVAGMIAPGLYDNLIRYAVGRAIFCPACGACLDYRRAVLFGLQAVENGKEEELLAAVACKACHPAALAKIFTAAREALAKLAARGSGSVPVLHVDAIACFEVTAPVVETVG